MHIMEGYLPPAHAVGWWATSAPFLAYGAYAVKKTFEERPESKLLLGTSGGFAFVLSALKMPSFVGGSCSHPTGIGLGAILFGPSVMTILGFIVLLFQALLLAHGGLTTLGANGFSMAIVGSWVAYGVFVAGRRLRLPFSLSVFLAAALADLLTYVVTAFQLAWAYPDKVSGFAGALAKFMTIFAATQVPLAVSEGLLTVMVMNFLTAYSRAELQQLAVLPEEVTP